MSLIEIMVIDASFSHRNKIDWPQFGIQSSQHLATLIFLYALIVLLLLLLLLLFSLFLVK